MAFSLILTLLSFIYLFKPTSISNHLQSLVNEQQILTKNNIDVWGNYTQDHDVHVIQKIRFFDYQEQNQDQWTIKQSPQVIVRERHYVDDLQFSKDKNYVTYMKSITRKDPQSESFEIKMPNFLGYFFWNKLQNLPLEERIWNGLTAIISQFVENNYFIKAVAMNLIHDQLRYKDFNFFRELVKGYGFTLEQIKTLHSDQYFGLGTKQGIFRWIEYYEFDNNENEKMELRKNQIKNYFSITKDQVMKIFVNLKNSLQTLQDLLKTLFECDPCTSYELFKRQWSQSEVSQKLLGQDSMEDKKQVFGFLEFNKFFNERLKDNQYFKDARISLEQSQSLLRIDVDYLDTYKGWDTLIHKQNIIDILTTFKEKKNVDEIVERFKFKNKEQALAVYLYLKYIGEEFVPMTDIQGTMEYAGIGSIFGEYMKLYFEKTVQFFHDEIFPLSFVNFFKTLNITCEQIFQDSLPIKDDEITKKFCGQISKEELPLKLYQNCETNETEFQKILPKNYYYSLCYDKNQKENSYYQIKQRFNQKMNEIYGEENISPENFSIVQILSQKITQTKNELIEEKYKPVDNLSLWNNEIFKIPFELSHFAKTDEQKKALEEYNIQKLAKLMSNEGFFNVVVVQRSILLQKQGDQSFFEQSFDLKNFDFFYSYVKFMILDVAIGGQFITVNDQQIKNGLINNAIKRLSEKPILKGGDPSAPYIFYAAKPFEKVQMKMNTGKTNMRLNDSYQEYQNQEFLTSNQLPYYNGNCTIAQINNPWREKVVLQGSEVITQPIRQGEDDKNPENLFLKDLKGTHSFYHIESLGRVIKLNYQEETLQKNFHNFKKYIFKVDDSEFENNDQTYKFYQDQLPNGVFNSTQVMGGPIFISRGNFYGTEKVLRQNVKILDENNEELIPTQERDDIYIHFEKHSRANVKIQINLLVNTIYEKNEIFEPWINGKNHLIPLFSLQAGVDFSEQEWNAVLGDLKIVYFIQNHHVLIFLLCFFIFLLLSFACFFGGYKLQQNINEENQDKKNETLIEQKDELI